MQNQNKKPEKPSMIPPTYFFIGLIFIIVCEFLPDFPIPFLYPLVAPYFGGLCMSLGIGLVIWIWDIMEHEETPHNFDKPLKLLISKAFKFSRNPMYIGLLLILIGGVFIVNSIFAIIAPVMMFIVLDKLFIPYEEARMHEVFGNDYLKYKKRTRRWF